MLRVYTIAIFVAWVVAAQVGNNTAASQLLEEANGHYRARRSADAVRLYREYLANHPGRADVRVYLGAALLNMNQLGAALEEARLAIATGARLAKAYVLAGRIFAEQRQWGKAQEFFAEASQIDPSDLDAWYFSGRTFYEAGQFNQSIQALSRAGSGARVDENLGLAYEASGKFSEASAAYKRAVEFSNGVYRPYLSYGVFLFKQGRPGESLSMLQEAVRLEPDATDARFELARVLYQSARFAEAVSVLPVVVPPNQCRVHHLRGRILMRLTKPEEAQRDFDAFHSCESKSMELRR